MTDPAQLRVLVFGGRHFGLTTDESRLFAEVMEDWRPRIKVVIHGDCGDKGRQDSHGADRMADIWAEHYGIPRIRMPACWGFYDKAAGPVRNAWMVDIAGPTQGIGFPGGRGTADMEKRLLAAGIPVSRYRL